MTNDGQTNQWTLVNINTYQFHPINQETTIGDSESAHIQIWKTGVTTDTISFSNLNSNRMKIHFKHPIAVTHNDIPIENHNIFLSLGDHIAFSSYTFKVIKLKLPNSKYTLEKQEIMDRLKEESKNERNEAPLVARVHPFNKQV